MKSDTNLDFKPGDIVWVVSPNDTGMADFKDCIAEISTTAPSHYITQEYTNYYCFVHTGELAGRLHEFRVFHKDLKLLIPA